MECTYEEGKTSDLVSFTRSGVNGELRVTKDRFELHARLGFLLGAFKDRIEAEIVKNLDALLEQKDPVQAFQAGVAEHTAKRAPRPPPRRSRRPRRRRPDGRAVAAQPYNLARFDLVSIRLAVACARHGSLTQAAQESHLALAAASRRIRDLESALGEPLFERHARGVRTTAAGRVFAKHGLALLQALEQMGGELADLRHGVTRHLRLCASTASISQFLPPLLASYARTSRRCASTWRSRCPNAWPPRCARGAATWACSSRGRTPPACRRGRSGATSW
jgi:molybdate transport repressor ModE-like protein